MAAPSSSTPFFGIREEDQNLMKQQHSSISTSSAAATTAPQKKKRNLPGTPNPDAEVIALSPKTLMATNRFICEVCNKGFQREQNLQLHRRGHNLPWKLKQKTTKEVKRKVYLCPEPTCVHHDPSRALGDLTGIKKHYSRKHGEKKYKCEKCSKRYAVQSDWKAHSKTCGTREYRCDCGTLFSRRDSFITHRAFCDALAQESTRHPSGLSTIGNHLYGSNHMSLGLSQVGSQIPPLQDQNHPSSNILRLGSAGGPKYEHLVPPPNSSLTQPLQSMPSAAFFIPDSNQGYPEQSQHELMPNKPFHGLMQLPDLQGNTSNNSPSATAAAAANLFNLGFFSSSSTTSSINNGDNGNHNNTSLSSSGFLIPDQFNNGNGGGQGTTLFSANMGDNVASGLSSLYSTSVQHEKQASLMSATALLQKAAQLGSTTSSAKNASLLKGIGSSSSSGAKSDMQLMSTNLGRSTFGGETLRSQMENENQLQGLLNSFANGSSSIFGGGNELDNNFDGFNESVIPMKQQHNNTNFGNLDEAKLHQNFAASIGGSDKLTLDFLGVGGGMVRNMGGAFSQREQQLGIDMSSLDPKIKSAQTSHVFGNPKLQ
ncbi:hypothetical protein F0562_032369 [Nyssa sinensis]|uniref:C2H2-type domain-containing protein n=1 Tax=Nyssa sinensis TaxID=561372 RepID=A0A5J5ARC9_9ASTE|nr:hypothetical protein F0562_032369 [Nyssa sinensis]